MEALAKLAREVYGEGEMIARCRALVGEHGVTWWQVSWEGAVTTSRCIVSASTLAIACAAMFAALRVLAADAKGDAP